MRKRGHHQTVHPRFHPVRGLHEGGTDVPVPVYLLTFKGEALRAVAHAREALDFLAGAGSGWACLSVIDGKTRECVRNPVEFN